MRFIYAILTIFIISVNAVAQGYIPPTNGITLPLSTTNGGTGINGSALPPNEVLASPVSGQGALAPRLLSTSDTSPNAQSFTTSVNLAPNYGPGQSIIGGASSYGWLNGAANGATTVLVNETSAPYLHGTDTASVQMTTNAFSTTTGDPTKWRGPPGSIYYANNVGSYSPYYLSLTSGHVYMATIYVYATTSGIPVWFYLQDPSNSLSPYCHYGSMIGTTVANTWVPITLMAAPPNSSTTTLIGVAISPASGQTSATAYLSSFNIFDVTGTNAYASLTTPISPITVPNTFFGISKNTSYPAVLTFNENTVTQSTNSGWITNGWHTNFGTTRTWDEAGLAMGGTAGDNVNLTTSGSYTATTLVAMFGLAQSSGQSQLIYTYGSTPPSFFGGSALPSNPPSILGTYSIVAGFGASIANLAAANFSGTIYHELWNEWDNAGGVAGSEEGWTGTVNWNSSGTTGTDMVTYANLMYNAIKAAKPNQKVIAPSITNLGLGAIVSYFYPWPNETYAGVGDAVAFHVYPSNTPAQDINFAASLRFSLTQLGKGSLQLLMDEGGYGFTGTPTTIQYQGGIGEFVLNLLYSNVSLWNYYQWSTTVTGVAPLAGPAGSTTTSPTTLTTAGQAMVNIQNWLIGATIGQKTINPDGTTVLYVELPAATFGTTKPGYIIYNPSGVGWMQLPPSWNPSTELDLAGNVYQITPQQVIPTSTAPVLVY